MFPKAPNNTYYIILYYIFFFFYSVGNKNRAQPSRKKRKNTQTHTPRDDYFTSFNNIAQSMAMQ